MILDFKERITLLQILPKEGSYVTIKILMDLRAALAFSEEEIKDCNISENKEDMTIMWEKSVDKDVDIGEKATEIICNVLKKIDEEERVNDQNITLFEKFIKT
jgi:hypothetical protein